MLTVVTNDGARAEDAAAGLDEIVRDGARRMLIAAIEMEASGYVEALTGELDEHGTSSLPMARPTYCDRKIAEGRSSKEAIRAPSARSPTACTPVWSPTRSPLHREDPYAANRGERPLILVAAGVCHLTPQ
jgi:hypothetical protein